MEKTFLIKQLFRLSLAISVLSCCLSSSYALEIDEKLTMRFLKVSNSKKTVLVNRGSEDGLVVGDHAKFFITQGVIARGVVVKASPSRTIWSVYRIVDPEEIVEGKVLNLKISTPVKLTDDPSKSLKDEGVEMGNDKIAIPLADGADDLPKELSGEDKEELKDLGTEKVLKEETSKVNSTKNIFTDNAYVYSPSNAKNWELFSSFYLSSLSGSQEDDSQDSTETTSSALDFSAGVEKYFPQSSMSFLQNSSIIAFVRMRKNETGSSSTYGFNNTEFGGGINYHLFESPFAMQKFIGLVSFSAGLGSVTRSIKTVNNNTVEEESLKGSSRFMSFGAGVKMAINRNWGARFLLDYYIVNSSFEDDAGNSVELSQSGPRANFGISYAF